MILIPPVSSIFPEYIIVGLSSLGTDWLTPSSLKMKRNGLWVGEKLSKGIKQVLMDGIFVILSQP